MQRLRFYYGGIQLLLYYLMNIQRRDLHMRDASLQCLQPSDRLVVADKLLRDGDGQDGSELVGQDVRLEALQVLGLGEWVQGERVPHLGEEEIGVSGGRRNISTIQMPYTRPSKIGLKVRK